MAFEKTYYAPKAEPSLITVPPLPYFVIHGEGDPNGPVFAEAVGALYALSYGVKMMPKSGVTPPGYEEYKVFPLEGVWDIKPGLTGFDPKDKEQLVWDAMIRQPDFVTPKLAAEILAKMKAKKPSPSLDRAAFRTWEDGLCVHMMHVGPYDDEPASFARMDEFMAREGLVRVGHTHREIYLSDPRRCAPEKMRTVLRAFVRRK